MSVAYLTEVSVNRELTIQLFSLSVFFLLALHICGSPHCMTISLKYREKMVLRITLNHNMYLFYCILKILRFPFCHLNLSFIRYICI